MPASRTTSDGTGGAAQPHDQEQGQQRQHQLGRGGGALERRHDEAQQHARQHARRRPRSAGAGSARRRAGTRPSSTTSAPASRKAPTAAGSPIAPPVAAISAAPGVDQAVMIGWRWRRLSQLLVAAMARQSAVTQDEVCAGSAPDRAGRRDDDRQRAAEADQGRDHGRDEDREGHRGARRARYQSGVGAPSGVPNAAAQPSASPARMRSRLPISGKLAAASSSGASVRQVPCQSTLPVCASTSRAGHGGRQQIGDAGRAGRRHGGHGGDLQQRLRAVRQRHQLRAPRRATGRSGCPGAARRWARTGSARRAVPRPAAPDRWRSRAGCAGRSARARPP